MLRETNRHNQAWEISCITKDFRDSRTVLSISFSQINTYIVQHTLEYPNKYSTDLEAAFLKTIGICYSSGLREGRGDLAVLVGLNWQAPSRGYALCTSANWKLQ